MTKQIVFKRVIGVIIMQESIETIGKIEIDEKIIGVFMNHKLNRTDVGCCVCMDDNLPLSRLIILQCTHLLCVQCLGKILVRRIGCPLCRAKIRGIHAATYTTAKNIATWQL